MKITTLIEDHKNKTMDLYYQHGISMLIEDGDDKLLFDTGRDGRFIDNYNNLVNKYNKNISMDDLKTVVISHAHNDHSGGLLRLLNEKKGLNLYVGKGFFEGKFRITEDGRTCYISNPLTYSDAKKLANQVTIIDNDLLQLTDNIYIVRQFKKTNDIETIPANFVLNINNEKFEPDQFADEVAIAVKTPKGIVLCVGCSHPGVINIARSVSEKLDSKIRAIIGGTHLTKCTMERLDFTVAEFRKMDLDLLAVSHCTGDENIERLRTEFKDIFVLNNTGNTIIL